MSATIGPDVLVHQLLGAFFLPPLLLILITLAGLVLLRRRPRPARTLIAVSLLLQYGLATPLVAVWLNTPLEPPVASLDQVQQTGAIVVLGGGKRYAPETDRTELTSDTLLRLRYGAWLARKTGKPLLVSGGAPLGGEPEAVVMARTLEQDYGLAARWQEPASNTTRENARLSRPLLVNAGIKRITLVSQGWHLGRAVPAFRAEGFDVLAAPTGMVRYEGPLLARCLPRASALSESTTALREWIGQLFYRINQRSQES